MIHMEQKRIVGFVVSFLLIAGSFAAFSFFKVISPSNEQTAAFVERVVDGDTVLLSDGEYVRLLGIDTPERSQLLYEEAKARLQQLAETKNVTLEKDVTNKDKYQRLLRSLFVNNSLANVQIVRDGLARPLVIGPDRKYADLIAAAAEQARLQGTGVWNLTEGQWCVYIRQFSPNPPGADEHNLNGEKVVLRNKCTTALQLDGWMLSNTAGRTFLLPNLTILPKGLLTVRSGNGTDNATDVFLSSVQPAWKNSKEAATLRDGEGRLVARLERG